MMTVFYDASMVEVLRAPGRMWEPPLPLNAGPVTYEHVVEASDVRLEASRRLQALFGARDAEHLNIIISNATREAVRLLRIKEARDWTTEEATRAAELEGADALVEAIRAASNAMEDNPPADYADNSHWPS